jgi:hypothetical protein
MTKIITPSEVQNFYENSAFHRLDENQIQKVLLKNHVKNESLNICPNEQKQATHDALRVLAMYNSIRRVP